MVVVVYDDYGIIILNLLWQPTSTEPEWGQDREARSTWILYLDTEKQILGLVGFDI